MRFFFGVETYPPFLLWLKGQSPLFVRDKNGWSSDLFKLHLWPQLGPRIKRCQDTSSMRHLLDDFEMPDLFPHDWFVASTLAVNLVNPSNQVNWSTADMCQFSPRLALMNHDARPPHRWWCIGPQRSGTTVRSWELRLMQSGLLASNTPCDDFTFELLRYFMTSERLDAIRS